MNRVAFILLVLTYIHPSKQSLQTQIAQQLQRDFLTPLLITPCARQLLAKYANVSDVEGAMTLFCVMKASAGPQRHLLKQQMENLDMNFMIKKGGQFHYSTHNVIEKARMYVFMVEDASESEANVRLLRTLPTWNAMAKVVVFFPFELAADVFEKQRTATFDYLYGVGFFDIIVMGRVEGRLKIRSYSFFPYDHGNCAREVKHVQLIDECEMHVPADLELDNVKHVETYISRNRDKIVKVKEFRRVTGKLLPKIPGCIVNVSVADFEPYTKIEANKSISKGIEVDLMKTVIENKMLGKIRWIPISAERRYLNFSLDNTTGIYADILSR